MHKLITLILSAIITSAGLHAERLFLKTPTPERCLQLSKAVNHNLSLAKSPADSLHLLYDLFDLAPRHKKYNIGKTIYGTATRAGNNDIRLDILRQMANLVQRNDSLHNILLRECLTIPESDEQKATQLFIRIAITNSNAADATDDERQDYLMKILKEYTNLEREQMLTDDDLYNRLYYLNAICAYMACLSKGQLLTQYLDEYGDLVKMLPRHIDAIENTYLTQLANAYTYTGERRKAIEADKALIQNLYRMQNDYLRTGRQYRNYNSDLYNCFRRILSNYEALTPAELSEYYGNIQKLVTIDPVVATEFNTAKQADTYYAMATKQYNKAIELIQGMKGRYKNPVQAVQMLRMLKEAAKATDNEEVLLQAALEYNDSLEKYVDMRAHERYHELQILYDVWQLKSDNSQLFSSQNEENIRQYRQIIAGGIIGIIILLALFTATLVSYRRAKKLTKHLAETNRELSTESENLRLAQHELIAARDKASHTDKLKTEFINNMNHEAETPLSAIVEYSQLIADIVTEDKREYVIRFADIISVNAEILQTLVNDMLTINTLDKSQMNVKRLPVSLHDRCATAIATIHKQVKPDVDLIFANKDDAGNSTIITDGPRLEQVLINLLSNAAKFTEKGSITLRYDFNSNRSEVSISVTDTGPGISSEIKDRIFERFYKADKYTQGMGLGLPICRMIVQLLGGEIELDTSYAAGARFVFTIPTTA